MTISWRVSSSACPTCKTPVTFGGGRTMENFSFLSVSVPSLFFIFGSLSGLKYPESSQVL